MSRCTKTANMLCCTDQGEAFLGQVMAQVLCSAAKKLAQLTDPRQTQWDTKEPIEDAEDATLLRLGGDVSVTYEHTKPKGLHWVRTERSQWLNITITTS